MLFNKLLFPAPDSSYNAQSRERELIWIPKRKGIPDDIPGMKEKAKSRPTTPSRFKFFESILNKFKRKESVSRSPPKR
jgi:hypothetical protein